MSDVKGRDDVWLDDKLEVLGSCPVCKSRHRKTLLADIRDRVYGLSGRWTYWRCLDCRAIYLDPRPNEENIAIVYENYYTHDIKSHSERRDNLRVAMRNDYLHWKYGYELVPRNSLGRYFFQLTPSFLRHEWDRFARHLLKPVPGKNRLLDVGCGDGGFLLQAQQTGWEAEGLEFDSTAAKIVRNRGLIVHTGGMREITAEHYDVVTLSHVIEHVHDPTQFLAECLRVLKPGGMIWVATPNMSSLGFLRYGEDCVQFHPDHLVLFSPELIKSLLTRMGVEKIEFKKRGFHIPYYWGDIIALRKGEPPQNARLPNVYFPFALAVEIFDSLFPRFQEELIAIGYKAL